MDEKTQKISKLRGRPVVSMVGGVKVGTVKDVLIETESLKATALLIEGDSGRGGLPFSDVLSVGEDAVTVENASSVIWASSTQPGPGRESHEIFGLPVIDATGASVGIVHEIDLLGDRIHSLDVQSGGVFGIGATHSTVLGPSIRSIGARMVTVEPATN